MTMQKAIQTVVERIDLTDAEMTRVMELIMTGEATPAQIGGFLIGLRMKGETVEEVAAAASVMRDLATRVEVADRSHLVDIVGTGGDGMQTFNVSTTSCFVLAAAGGRVAKHGNRSVSSSSGSADVLEAAGVRLDLSPEQVARCIEEVGVGFMFAPLHHSAMKHAIGPRREMGVRTIFNVLGPLTNPAGAPNQLLGVFADSWVRPLAEALQRLGSRHVMVVHSEDGLDEISIAAPTRVAELRDGAISEHSIAPEDFGISRGRIEDIRVANAEESLRMMLDVLDGKPGAARDIVQLNAGAAIYIGGLADDLGAGIARAGEVIDSGAARARLDALVELSNAL
ncbi:MAG: anthranilate phosphoribosyltransferase [Gammaproteobacteria bacterium]|nr:MAG: anthranilate phosphoribosyltransferase [Gammaproteobacteria bacterium]